MKKVILIALGCLLASCVRQPSRSHPGEKEWVWISNAELH